MFKISRSNSENKDFKSLVEILDKELSSIDGEDHTFYSQFNSIELMNQVVLLYDDEVAVGCGALKEYDKGTVEIKRMFTLPAYRGKGVASLILGELEKLAEEEHYSKCVLETGQRQRAAVTLYLKNGYSKIPNYGPYVGVTKSLCFEKVLDGS